MNPNGTNKRPGVSVPPSSAPPAQQAGPSQQNRPDIPRRLPPPRPDRSTSNARDKKDAGGQVADQASVRPPPNRMPPRQRGGKVATSEPRPLRNEQTASPDRRPPASKMEDIDETASKAKPSIDNVKPVLKKETEPSSRSTKKQKKKEPVRVKSVTFTDGEAGAVAALASALPATIKPATKTGFTELPFRDFLVILGLWFMRFFIPWIDAWHSFNFYLLREPSFWDPLEADMRVQELIVFCVMSVLTVLVSATADYVNCRFFIFLALHVLLVLCPLAGGFVNSVLVARAYNQDYYRRWAVTSDTLFHWASSITFVSFPIQLSCIFGQIDTMSRQAHYNWTAFLVFLESANRYISFWVIPGKCPTKTFTQTAIWFLIGVLIVNALLFNTNFTLEWAKPEIVKSKWQSQETAKDKDDEEIRSKRGRKCIWFSSILTLLIINAVVFATLDRLNPDDEWDKHYVLSATSMFYLGGILGAAIMCTTLPVVRWTLQYYFHLPFLRPDVLALGLPHIINLIALVMLLGRFATLSNLKEGDVIIGPVPENKKMVVEFYNFNFRNTTVCVHSTYFRPLKISPRQRGTREIYSGTTRIYFTVTSDPQTTPGLSVAESFEYRDNGLVTFVITLPFSSIKYTDVQALYNKPEIVRVDGTESIRPKKKPQLYFMNTFVTDNSTKWMWMFLVKQSESGFEYEFKYNLRWQTVILEVPKGRVEIIYHLVNSSSAPEPLKTTIQMEDYTVWSVLLGHARPMKKEEISPQRMLKAYKTMETARPDSGQLPSKSQLQRDAAVMASMTLAGMAYSGLFIGTIYLFWLDTPYVAFRTSCIGVFWVLLNTPAELSKVKVIDIGFKVITVLAFLQILCTVLHFFAAARLYSPRFNFRERLD